MTQWPPIIGAIGRVMTATSKRRIAYLCRGPRAHDQAIMLGAANRVRLGLSAGKPGSAGFAWRLRYLDQAIPPSTERPRTVAWAIYGPSGSALPAPDQMDTKEPRADISVRVASASKPRGGACRSPQMATLARLGKPFRQSPTLVFSGGKAIS